MTGKGFSRVKRYFESQQTALPLGGISSLIRRAGVEGFVVWCVKVGVHWLWHDGWG